MTITSKDPDQAPFGTVAGGGPPRRKFTRYAGSGAEMTATEKKMSRRDKARRDFIRNFKLKQLSKKSLKNTIIAERERFLDFQE